MMSSAGWNYITKRGAEDAQAKQAGEHTLKPKPLITPNLCFTFLSRAVASGNDASIATLSRKCCFSSVRPRLSVITDQTLTHPEGETQSFASQRIICTFLFSLPFIVCFRMVKVSFNSPLGRKDVLKDGEILLPEDEKVSKKLAQWANTKFASGLEDTQFFVLLSGYETMSL